MSAEVAVAAAVAAVQAVAPSQTVAWAVANGTSTGSPARQQVLQLLPPHPPAPTVVLQEWEGPQEQMKMEPVPRRNKDVRTMTVSTYL